MLFIGNYFIVSFLGYFAAALKQHGVPVELFLYEKGPHGYGVNNKTAKAQWIDDFIDWIKKERYKR